MEHAPELQTEHQRIFHLPSRQRAIAIGATILAPIGLGYNVLSDKSGDVTVHKPTIEVEQPIGTHVSMVNLNTYGQILANTAELREMTEAVDADAVMLQEVDANDAERLADRYPKMYVTHVIGERLLQQPDGGGFGNVIMTRQKPTDIKTRSILVNPILDKAKNAVSDVLDNVAHADTPLPNFDKLLEERRAIMALSIKILGSDNTIKDLRLVTTHISRVEPVASQQMDTVEDFIKDEIKDSRPMAFCGDLNQIPAVALPRFRKMGFIIPKTTHTSTRSKATIDYCMYRKEGVLENGTVEVKKSKMSDHYPLMGSLTTTKPPSKCDKYYGLACTNVENYAYDYSQGLANPPL